MSITPELHAFLETHAFAAAWQRIQNHSASHDQLRRQFHCWFDGFRTLKLIHHLRENSHPEQEMFASLATLFDMAGWDEGNRFVPALRDNLPAQRAALGVLRERSRHELVRAGLGA